MNTSIFFLVIFSGLISAQVSNTIGNRVEVPANVDTTITYTDVPIVIVVNPTESANVSINYYTGGALSSLPTGYTTANFVGGSGYNIDVTPNTVVLNKFLFTSEPLNANSKQAAMASSTQMPVLVQYDGNLQYFSQATFDNAYNSTSGQITANLVQSGSFFPAIRSTDVLIIPSFYTYRQFVAANSNISYTFPSSFGVYAIESDVDNTLIASQFGGNPNGVGNGNYVSLNAFWSVRTTTQGASVSAVLSYVYDQTEVNNGKINESTLEFWRYDGSKWVTEGGAVVDTDNNVLAQRVTTLNSNNANTNNYYGVWGLKNGETAMTSANGQTTSDASIISVKIVMISAFALIVLLL